MGRKRVYEVVKHMSAEELDKKDREGKREKWKRKSIESFKYCFLTSLTGVHHNFEFMFICYG